MSIIKPRPMPPFPKPPREDKQRFPNGFPVGKRTQKRQAVNHKLNRALQIKECELKLPGCWRIVKLTWAHSKKSRFLVTLKDWLTAARACIHCHDIVEAMPHEEMEKVINAAIAKRPAHLQEELKKLCTS